MNKKLAIFAAIAGIAVIAGCTKKAEMTKATPVENPPELVTSKPVTAPPKPLNPKAEQAPTHMTSSTSGFTKTASGLQYKDKKTGKGTAVKAGDKVMVNYTGWLDDGSVFDTSKKVDREPFEFVVGQGQVIKGWDEGLQGMKVDGVRELKIPSSLGYGEQGSGPIPPGATLHFEIELLKIGD